MSVPKPWSDFLAEDYISCLADYNELIKIEDPETEPFKSKEKAIEILESLKENALNTYSKSAAGGLPGEGEDGGAKVETGRTVEDVVASLTYRIGALAVETEQVGKGQKLLSEALEHMETRYLGSEDAPVDKTSVPLKCIVELQDLHNILGTLWCNRSEHAKAEEHLKRSEQIFKQWNIPSIGSSPLGEVEAMTRDQPEEVEEEEEAVKEAKAKAALEKMNKNHIQTSFYLAQVYGHLGRAEDAARYCAETLDLQLNSGEEFDRAEWAQNAAQLAGFFLSKSDFLTAERCIAAANIVYQQKLQRDKEMDNPKDDTDVEANLKLAWGKLYAKQLEEGVLLVGEDQADIAAALQQAEGMKVAKWTWESLPLPSPSPLLNQIPTNFQEARAVFNLAMPYFTQAAQYYQLDGFVTEHVELLLDTSSLYKHLAVYETDPHRQCIMHEQRAKPLDNIFKKINPKIFEGLYKQVAFELGEIYRTKMDIKRDTGRPFPKVFSEGVKSVSHYTAYIKAVEGENGPSTRVHKNEERSYFSARFCMAGALQRMHHDQPGNKDVTHLSAALKEFEGLIKYSKLIPGNEKDTYLEELQICEDMAELLPAKINGVHSGKLIPLSKQSAEHS